MSRRSAAASIWRSTQLLAQHARRERGIADVEIALRVCRAVAERGEHSVDVDKTAERVSDLGAGLEATWRHRREDVRQRARCIDLTA